jgi:hypothetical protein
MGQNARIISARTQFLIFTAASVSAIAGLALGLIGVGVPLLTILATLAQRWWPRLGTSLTLAFLFVLNLLTLPQSFHRLFIGDFAQSLRQSADFNSVVMFTSLVLAGPLVAATTIVLLVELGRRPRERAPK